MRRIISKFASGSIYPNLLLLHRSTHPVGLCMPRQFSLTEKKPLPGTPPSRSKAIAASCAAIKAVAPNSISCFGKLCFDLPYRKEKSATKTVKNKLCN